MGIKLSEVRDDRTRRMIMELDAKQNAVQLAKGAVPAAQPSEPRRTTHKLRQDPKPLLNKLEEKWQAELRKRYGPDSTILAQAMRFKLANGLWYKPDFVMLRDPSGRMLAWEVKGPHAFRGGKENLKVAATTYRQVLWRLVSLDKTTGMWQEEKVLP